MESEHIEALVAQGRFREAASALDSLTNPSPSQKVLRAYVRSECEGPRATAEAASSLLNSDLDAVGKSLCLDILGRAAAHAGDLPQAVRLLERAVRIVEGIPIAAARAEMRFTRSVLVWIGVEPALARLPRLRKAVTASGDGYSSVGFYLICAEIEMKRYRKASAESCLATVCSLLERYPNLMQEAKLLELRANHAALCSDYKSALEIAQAWLQRAAEAGWLIGHTVALSNIGYFSLVSGELTKASKYIRRPAMFGADSPITLGDLANELELALALDDLELASRLAQNVRYESSGSGNGYSYSGVSELIAKMRWLIRNESFSDAARIATEALPSVKGMDRYLYVRLRLFASEALAKSGRVREAIVLLSDVLNEVDLPCEHLGEAYRVRAIITSDHDVSAAGLQFDRAARILNFAGLLTASREVARNVAAFQRIAIAKTPASASPESLKTRLAKPATILSEVIDSLLTVSDVLAAPELVGRELLGVIQSSGFARSGTLVVDRVDASKIVASFGERGERTGVPHVDRLHIDIPGDDKAKWRLEVAPQPDVTAQLAILALGALLRRLYRRNGPEFRESLLGSPFVDDLHADASGIVVAAESMTELLNITRRVAASNVTVLFTGETGTGKELLARALHEASPRNSKPFIPFNCNAVSREMLDSQLFGYRRGAFTGAHTAFPGVIRAAAGGTLFLDEIGEMSLDVQPKLLRFLESSEIHPLGEPRPIAVDVRIVAATNANLEQLVAEGRFREDLFYRLNVVRLQVPPLRERREEIPLLVQHFIDKFSRESHKAGIRVAEETMEYLVLYKWPGNVRQLANEIRRIVALAESGAVLMPEHLSPQIAASRRTVPPSQRDTAPTEFVVRMDQPMSAAIEHLERSMIQYAMSSTEGRFEDAAQLLGLSRKGLYLKRQRLKMAGAALREDDENEAGSQAEEQG